MKLRSQSNQERTNLKKLDEPIQAEDDETEDEEVENEEVEEILQNYLTPGHPTFLRGLGGLLRFYPQMQVRDARKMQSKVDAYTTRKEAKRPSTYNPIYTYGRREILQIDLVEVQHLSEFNDGTRYLLMAIDTFSRKAWIEPLKNKKTDTVLKAFERIIYLARPGSFNKLLCDQGKEFTNREFKQFLEDHGIKMIHLYSDQKAAHVERFNRTFKKIMYSYMKHFDSKRYIDALPDLLQSYNSRYHRMIGMSPNHADKAENRSKVLGVTMPYYHSVQAKRKNEPSYKVGQKVRIQKTKKVFDRGFRETFTEEIFTVYKIDLRKPIILYFLKDKNDEKVEGGFYSQELQSVS